MPTIRHRVALAISCTIIAACGGASPRPELAPLRDPAAPTPPPPVAPDLTADFTPPPSAPSGEPVTIPRFVPEVGMKRTRSIQTRYVVIITEDGVVTRDQKTLTRFELREEIVGTADPGVISRLQVIADTAEESIELGSAPIHQTLLAGTYEVTPDGDGPHGGLGVTRGAGRTPVYGREQEELTTLYSGEIGTDYPLNDLLTARPLRLGETVTLTGADKEKLELPADAPATISLTLQRVDGEVATYQVISTLTAPSAFGDPGDVETVGLKLSIAVHVTTGRILRLDQLERRAMSGKVQETFSTDASTAITYQ